MILPHGILFRDNVEADIRKNIIQKGYIKGIIGLPANLFYGTGISACIIVIDKENAANRRGIFMIDASKGFVKDSNKNRLRHQDIHKIVDVFNKQIELPEYSRLVSVAEIAENGYNLNIPVYFAIYAQPVTALFEQWQMNNISNLKSFGIGNHPRQLINTLSEDMLQIFSATKLIDKYDMYQHLMNYWSKTMQDEMHMIALDGWKANSDLVPPRLIINRYFATEQQAIEQLQTASETITRKIEEINEKYGGERGLLKKAKNENGKITKASIKTRLKDIFADFDAVDERTLLNAYLDQFDHEAEVRKKAKDAQKTLDAKVNSKYRLLSEDEVKTLVVEDKWLTTLASDVQPELNRVSQAPTRHVEELGRRYATPHSKHSEDTEALNNIEQRSNSTRTVKILGLCPLG